MDNIQCSGYYAHTGEDGARQLLKDHLTDTAERARAAAPPQLKNSAYLCGLLHDLGKYSPDFQKKLQGANISVDHSTYGAQQAVALFKHDKLAYVVAFVVAGHHAGLADIGEEAENSDKSTLRARLKKHLPEISWRAEMEDKVNKAASAAEKELMTLFDACPRARANETYEFVVRMLFSCLTDADFLDTEKFSKQSERQSHAADWAACLTKLEEKFTSFKQDTQLQRARTRLREQAVANIEKDAGIYMLDMPTGSGKTLCSMYLALKRALRKNKKRIIYVIPYTSIVEQTAKQLREIFPDVFILEHHSHFDIEEKINKGESAASADNEDIKVKEIIKHATENWDAPVIITTNVQFFESIYSNRSGRLRKLHNMADSVIVFDEMHTLPINYFIPCMAAVDTLTSQYGAEAVFLTATMPDYRKLYQTYTGKDLPVTPLLTDKSDYKCFEKCGFAFAREAKIKECAEQGKSCLVVCNSKAVAEHYFTVSAVAEEDKYCLSTHLTPKDRTEFIKEIRGKLQCGKAVSVFSTSLIEAGVDLDFECVFREMAGLENILQAAGRCNREGIAPKEDRVTYIFKSETGCNANKELSDRAEICGGIIKEFGIDNICESKAVEEYFNRLYRSERHITINDNNRRYMYAIWFKKNAERFNLIDSAQYAVLIPEKVPEKLLKELENGFPNKRKLQEYCASVSYRELAQLCGSGSVTDVNGVFVLQDPKLYDKNKGLAVIESGGDLIEY